MNKMGMALTFAQAVSQGSLDFTVSINKQQQVREDGPRHEDFLGAYFGNHQGAHEVRKVVIQFYLSMKDGFFGATF